MIIQYNLTKSNLNRTFQVIILLLLLLLLQNLIKTPIKTDPHNKFLFKNLIIDFRA